MALVTAADVRTLIPQLTGTNEDTRLDILIGQAESALARWLMFPRADDGAYHLDDTTYTFYLAGPRDYEPRELKLPIRPLVSVTSIYQDSDESYDTLVASTDYTTDLAAGVVLLVYTPVCGGWLRGLRPIKATVVAGWETAPGHVAQAIAYQVQHILGAARHGAKADDPITDGIDPRAADLLSADKLWEYACG